MDKEKVFAVKFVFSGSNIQTHMHNKNVTPQEAVGLLEMAKAQIVDNLTKNRQEVFSGTKKE